MRCFVFFDTVGEAASTLQTLLHRQLALHKIPEASASGQDPFPEWPFLGCLAGRRLTILLLTKRPRGRVEGLLAASGCRYLHLRECAPALELLQREPPDAVIVELPPRERDAVAAALCASRSGARPPRLIALVSDCVDAEAARRAGYDETVAEPLSLVELQGVLLGLAADIADAGGRA